MNERLPKSERNTPPLKEVVLRVLDSDVYLKAVVLSENDERFQLRFSDGNECIFSKEIAVPGNKVGNLEFISVNALDIVNQHKTDKADSALRLNTTDTNAEGGEINIQPQTSYTNKLRNNKRVRQTECKMQTNRKVNGKSDKKHPLGGNPSKEYLKKRNKSPIDQSSSSDASESPIKKRAFLAHNNVEGTQVANIHKSKMNKTTPKFIYSKQSAGETEWPIITDNRSITPELSKQRLEKVFKEKGINIETFDQSGCRLESNRDAISRRLCNESPYRRNGSSNRDTNKRSPRKRNIERRSPWKVSHKGRSPNVAAQTSVCDSSPFNKNTDDEVYCEDSRIRQAQAQDTHIDTRQAHCCSPTFRNKFANDEKLCEWYCSPPKRFITLFIVIVVCLYFIEHKGSEQEQQFSLFTITNSYISDILGSVYITFIVIAIFAPSSKVITFCCKSLALVHLFLLNYIILRILISQTQKWKEIATNIVIPCIMQMLYSIMAFYFQSPGNTLLPGVIHRVIILISPFIVSFPTIGSLHCQSFYEWITIYSGCTLYCLGLIIWISAKSEFQSIESCNTKVFHLGPKIRLVLPRVVKCRYPHYLGIIFINIGCSVIACSIWSIIIPLLVVVFLTVIANKWDNYYRTIDYKGWNIFERHIPHSVFPFHF